jgi:hypothetical protein
MATLTYGTLVSRIADELGGRSDLTVPSSGLALSPIQMAILDAIEQWNGERFYFNEYRTTGAFSTVVGQEFYTSADWADIATIHHIDKLSVLISGNRFFMTPRTEQYMEDVSMNTSWSGQPIDYAYYNFQLRFYPIPNGVYPVNVLGTKQFAVLSATGDSNVWTTTAEPLIRATAEKYLYRDTLHDAEKMQIAEMSEKQNYQTLKGDTSRHSATNKFRPTVF